MKQFLLEDIATLACDASRLYSFEGQDYLVYRLSDGLFATSVKCTHLFKSLAKGIIVSDKVVRCPLHHAEFDIRTGEVDKWACFPPGIQLLNGIRPEKSLQCYTVNAIDGNYYLTI